jgi:hypothetical protein
MNLSYLSRKLDEAIAGKKATRRVGASTGRHTCQHCGKKNLKKTVAVEDAKGRVRYYGATCYKNMSNDAAWFDFFKKKKEEPKKKEEQPQRTPDPYIIEMNRKSEPPEEKEKTYDPVILSPEDQKIAEAKSLEEFQKDIKWHYIFETLRKDYIHIPDFKGSKQFPSMRDVKLVIGTNEYNDFVEGAHIRQGLFLLKDGRYMSVEYQDNYEHDEEYAYYSLGNNFTNTVYAENNKRLEKNLKQQVANYEYAHPEHWDEPQPSSAPDTEKERKPISSKGEIPEVDVLEDLRNQKRA